MSGNRYGQRLTPREREICGALAMGERLPEIATRLCLSKKTVEAHLLNAKCKLGARTYPALTYAYGQRIKEAP